MLTRTRMAAVLGVLVLLVSLMSGSESAAGIVFANGQNVNVINGYGTSITASTDAANAVYLADGMYDSTQWNGSTANGTSVTIDLAAMRSVSTVRLYSYTGAGNIIANAGLESSSNGLTWTPVSGASYATSGTNEALITIPTAINAKYLRITRQDSSGTTWKVTGIRAYGPSGSLPADALNLINTSATWYGRSGYSGEDTYGDPFTDNPGTMGDHRHYNYHGYDQSLGNQTWVEFKPNQGQSLSMAGIGLTVLNQFKPTGNVHFQVHLSTTANNSESNSSWAHVGLPDGIPDFIGSTLALDYTGPLSGGPNYFLFPSIMTGSYLRIDFLSIQNSLGTEVRIAFGKIMVYEEGPAPIVPEPCTMVLLGASTLGALIRRVRR